jgi:catechol 2,3-dioxygenase
MNEQRTLLEYGIAPAGHRLPGETRLGSVRLQVADVKRSIDYYERVIGLRVIDRTAERATLGNTVEDDSIVELVQRAGARPVPRRGRLGLYHFAILLPERAALGSLVRHLESIGAYAGMSDHLVSEAIYLTDPDGLGIEVYADRPRETWHARNRELELQSAALDVADLVASAGGREWQGAPAGTRIGHVHLHVGDLARASAFYHDAVGFDKVVWSYPGALFLSAGGYHHHLGTNVWAAGAPQAEPQDAQLLEWTVQLPNQAAVDETAQSVAGGTFEIVRRGNDCVATDPWGTRVRFSALPARPPDRLTANQSCVPTATA